MRHLGPIVSSAVHVGDNSASDSPINTAIFTANAATTTWRQYNYLRLRFRFVSSVAGPWAISVVTLRGYAIDSTP